MATISIKNFISIATLAVAFCATQASAATINFATGGNGTAAGGTVNGGPLSYTTSASVGGLLNFAGGTVTQTGFGLGINGAPDLQATQIDGIAGWEALTVTFSWKVKLKDFSLGLLDNWDDYELAIDGGAYTHFGPNILNPISVNQNIKSFSIRASNSGEGFLRAGNDAFTLASANVAPVPVPAAGLMLLAGLAGLTAMRRKRASL